MSPAPFVWRDYLQLAVVLKAQGEAFQQRSCLRSATSRAYYAAFCHARNWAHTNHGFVIRHNAQDHWRLRRHFAQMNRIDVADKLDDMRKWRNNCDYEDQVSDPKKLAIDAIQDAESIFRSL